MKSREDLLKAARDEVREMSVEEVHEHLEAGNSPVLVDIRCLVAGDVVFEML